MSPHSLNTHNLHDNLARLISCSQPGQALLSEPKLAKQLGVSRSTLREAMRTFETQGLIQRRQGSGTFVLQPGNVIEAGLESLESIETMASQMGMTVTMGECHMETRSAMLDEAQALNLQTQDLVLVVNRVILVEERPVAFLVDIIPDGLLPASELTCGFTGSMLDLLLQRGKPTLSHSRCNIQASAASTMIAHTLGIQRGDVLLEFIAFLYASDGQVVDYSKSYFLPGYFRFHVMRRIASPHLSGQRG